MPLILQLELATLSTWGCKAFFTSTTHTQLQLFEDPDLTVNPNADEVAICFQSLTGPSCTADDDCPAGGWSCNIDWGVCLHYLIIIH